MSLYNYTIEYNIFENFDREKIFQYNIMPICKQELFLLVATSNKDLDENEIGKLFKSPVKLIVVDHQELQFEWRYYPFKLKLYQLSKAMQNTLLQKEDSKEIANLIAIILGFTIQNFGSDIHIESLHESMVIRIRIDGILRQFFRFDLSLFATLSSYIKYLANLDIAQRRLPLNSRFSYSIEQHDYDIRVSTLPTIYGESLVLRILNNQDTKKRLDEIGFNENIFNTLKRVLGLKQGLFLVTGPTGSGKTTTLYSMIEEINSLEKKIITIEDPVEYKIEGIMQVNINDDIELSYHTVLKNILRQDPDILLIGEIRDKESLKIAIQASLTGHLVFATLHTNNSIETILRLLDLDAEAYLIAATLQGVLSQRLVRVLCEACKTKVGNRFQASGCKECGYTGYKGRQVIGEILEVTNEIKNFIVGDKNIEQLQKYLDKEEFTSLKQSCQNLVQQGNTSHEECSSKV